MKLTEVKGFIESVSFETNRGFWINAFLSPSEYEYPMASKAHIPVERENLKGFDLQNDLHNRRIKVTVELLDD